uniref:NB-ARC domain-containing protein n=1 Tax=Meloidogyne hapla TaxID=6305 RepID=A0A1I8B202_MELHA
MDLISSEQRHLLSIGRVPMLRKRSVLRHKLLDKLGERIEKFCDNSDSQWFLIFGMPGCGKTHLLNSLLWEKPEISLALFDRVIWLTDRRMDEEGPLNLATVCLLIASLDSPQTCDEKSEEILPKDEVDMMGGETEGLLGTSQSCSIGNKLKTILENIPKKILLILDGVLNSETVRFFDEYKANNCKILATSTSTDLFTSVDYLDIFRLETDELDISELGQLLKKFGFEAIN